MAWRPIKSAPRDGTIIKARIPGHGDFLIFWQWGFVDEYENECGCWICAQGQEPPDCWTDGVCWGQNDDGRRSVWPDAWMPTGSPEPVGTKLNVC